MKISVVVPVYNEEKNVPEFLDRITPLLEGFAREYEIVFAMDPSEDRTEEIISAAALQNSRIKLLKFSRRFGQPMATLAGLQYSSGDAVVVMDVDLQDPPELIHEMVAKWREGFDVVVAQRKSRKGETWIKEIVSDIGYRLIYKISEVPIPRNSGDFRLMSRRVVDEVNKLKEGHGFLRGMVALVGFPQTAVFFERPPRFSGKGNYNPFLGSLRIGFNGLFCFSNWMLSLSAKAGFLLTALGGLLGMTHVVCRLAGIVPWEGSLLVAIVLFIGGIQLVSVGILGAYIGRIYEEVRERPKFIVDKAVNFDACTLKHAEQKMEN